MRLEKYMVNENAVDLAKGLLKRMSWKQLSKFLQGEFEKFMEAVQEAGMETQVVSLVNKRFDTKYRNLEQVRKMRLRESDEMLNEDLAHWWQVVKDEGFPTLAFYPALSVWLEIDKLWQGQDMDMKKTTIYALFWMLLVSGKYIKGWHKWKTENPEEHAAERAVGKGGIV